MFAQAIEALLTRHCTPQAVRAIEAGGSARALAAVIEESGFHALLAAEADGGGGLDWGAFSDIVLLCGTHAVPLPLAQTMAARRLVSVASALPDGTIAFAPTLVRTPGGGLVASHVPFARTANHVIGCVDDQLVLLPTVDAEVRPTGIHGSLAASFQWNSDADIALPATQPAAAFAPLAALLAAGQLAGAMKRAFDLTLDYANTRVQFGKPIGRFQAIQHQLAVMAEHVAASRIAVEAAFAGAARDDADGGWPPMPLCAIAKARASEAVGPVAATAHAVHGAIGVTEEYDLQLLTRRMHEWRLAHGSEAYWHDRLGRLWLASDAVTAADFVRGLAAGEVR